MVLGILLLLAACLLVGWLFMIFPRMGNGADTELLQTDYAHRGLWNEQIPENSLSAFARAVQGGYGIELDIQFSKDGQSMVFHDANLRRMCGMDARIGDLTYKELRKLRLKGTAEPIPTFSEVLKLVGGKVPLMIELKDEKPKSQFLLPFSELLDTYRGAFCVESFSPLTVAWFKNFRPNFARGQLVTKVNRHTRKGSRLLNFLLSHMLLNFLSRPDFLSVNGRIQNAPVFLFCNKVLKKAEFVWTVRSVNDYRTCRKNSHYAVFEGILPPKSKEKTR